MGRTNPVRRATTMFKCAGCHRDLPNPPARLVVAATFTMSVCERCASVRFEALQRDMERVSCAARDASAWINEIIRRLEVQDPDPIHRLLARLHASEVAEQAPLSHNLEEDPMAVVSGPRVRVLAELHDSGILVSPSAYRVLTALFLRKERVTINQLVAFTDLAATSIREYLRELKRLDLVQSERATTTSKMHWYWPSDLALEAVPA